MIDVIVGNNGLNPALEKRKPDTTKLKDRLSLREQLRQVMRENAGRLSQAKDVRKLSFERQIPKQEVIMPVFSPEEINFLHLR